MVEAHIVTGRGSCDLTLAGTFVGSTSAPATVDATGELSITVDETDGPGNDGGVVRSVGNITCDDTDDTERVVTGIQGWTFDLD